MLTIQSVFKMFGVENYTTGKQTITVGNQDFELYYSYEPYDNEDFHKLSVKNKAVYLADKSCKNPQWMAEDAQRLLDFLNQYAKPNTNQEEETKMKLLTLKTRNAKHIDITVKHNDQVINVSVYDGVVGIKMKKYFGTKQQIRCIGRNRKGNFVSIKGIEEQLLSLSKPGKVSTNAYIKSAYEAVTKEEVTPMNHSINLGTNVSINQVKQILTAYGLDYKDFHLPELKAMNSKVTATSSILTAMCSVLDGVSFLDPVGFINMYIAAVKKSGGYSSEALTVTLKDTWNEIAKDLHSTPEVHRIAKDLVIKTATFLSTNGHHTLKDLRVEMNLIAINLIAPQL